MSLPAKPSGPVPAPHGGVSDVPRRVRRETDPYRRLRSPAAIRDYYLEHGYVVVRGLIPAPSCDAARQGFAEQVKPYPDYIYRQTTANPERHQLTEKGFVLNPILNVQDLPSGPFAKYKEAALGVLTDHALQQQVEALLGEPGTLVQSMHFEGNPATWAHQDTYYLDSSRLGSMTGAWIALEDIDAGAGRFYVYPGSQRIDMVKNGGDFDVAFHHDRYRELVVDVMRKHGLECRAPAMNKGDVLFWTSRTVHGSLQTTDPELSRSSLTAHYIPRSTQLVQFQVRPRHMRLRTANGLTVHHPKDQDKALNRAILFVETRFPKPFLMAKKVAIKAMTSLKDKTS
jgi:phytanoyl-CoA hydroxylase